MQVKQGRASGNGWPDLNFRQELTSQMHVASVSRWLLDISWRWRGSNPRPKNSSMSAYKLIRLFVSPPGPQAGETPGRPPYGGRNPRLSPLIGIAGRTPPIVSPVPWRGGGRQRRAGSSREPVLLGRWLMQPRA